jgi:cobalt-zinc-cadmium efflux system membrane fusion protein
MLRVSKRRYLWIGLAVAIAIGGALVARFVPGVTASSQAIEKSVVVEKPSAGIELDANEARRAGIKVERIESTERAETILAFGTVGANRNKIARVTAPVAGRLIKIDANLGDAVSADTTLATLESPELAELRTTYRQDLTELDLAKVNFERAQKLTVGGGIADKDVQRARSDNERAQAALASVQAKLATLGVSAIAPSDTSPALLNVRAPLPGTVVERTAVLGEYAQAYQALFTVADLSTVWVETNLYDRDLGEVEVGASASVSLGAYPDRHFTGKVTYIGSILDKDTRTAVARVEVPNPDGRLKPGLFADVAIERATRRAALRVPENALVLMQGQMTAFVQNGESFEPRPVETGERRGGMVVVKSGLEAGDQVVVAGAFALKARLLKSQIGDVD